MGLSFEKFSFTKSTSTSVPVSQSVTLSGAFQPKALILWTDGSTAAGTFSEHWTSSFGFSDGTNDACVAQVAQDNAASATDRNVLRNDSIVQLFSSTTVTTTLSRASVTSFDSTGFTLSWGTNASGNPAAIIHGIAIGGTDITNVKVEFDTVTRTTTGSQAYTGVGFQPNFMLQIGHWDSYNVESTASNNTMIGCAMSASKEWSMCTSNTGGTTISGECYHRNDKCHVMLDNAAALSTVGELTSFDSDGYTMNYTSNGSAATDTVCSLLIKGGQWDVGTVTQRDNTGTQAITTAGIDSIKGAFFVTHGQVLSTAGTVQTQSRISIGGADATRQGYATMHNTDAAADAIIAKIQNTNGIVRVITAAATATSSTTQAQADFTSFGTNAININWSVADTTDRVVSWFAVGEAVTFQHFDRAVSESLTISAADKIQIGRKPAASLTISASPVVLRRVPIATSASFTISAAITKLGLKRVTASSLTITATTPLKVFRKVADSLVINAVTKISIGRKVSESLTVAASVVTKLFSNRPTPASFTITASPVRQLRTFRSVSESLTIDAVVEAAKHFAKSVSETLEIAATVQARISKYVKSVSESLAIDTTVSRATKSYRTVNESFTIVGDAVKRICKAVLETFI